MPRAVILGCEGPELTSWERGFFAETDPLGFIVFLRNCETPVQVRRLVDDLRASVSRADAPVLIDQEGGRVQRLKPPHWRAAPPQGRFGELALHDRRAALEAVEVNARLLAAELSELGITVNCLPLLDLRLPEGHGVIGDRGYGAAPDLVAELGRACCRGLLGGGVLPVIKHMPGHGRAPVNSHESLPRVETARDELERSDFAPFRALADIPWAMTNHVVYSAIDSDLPTTISPKVISEVIRGWMGFDGLLVTDDLSMKALSGGLGERAAAALAAGCDLALHCNGERAEMEDVAAATGPLTPAAERRVAAGAALLKAPPAEDRAALAARLEGLLASA